eukprot:CAMPEP_0183348284 /NCGR_PEP_ID=MMETSP0164_2-20130417/12837_1 /TAXON_ID=221442 /ORGANISM="Coccolithus pelagicus ssp braarudi, Strain PLY182g" /LENGTH=48 /DNA_ID= /DNA_START= /DNA_END= /DNA_ORIENTATION=
MAADGGRGAAVVIAWGARALPFMWQPRWLVSTGTQTGTLEVALGQVRP